MRVGSPSVPKKAACKADEGGKDGDWETAFWDRNIVVVEGGALVVGILDKADR